MKKKRGKRTPSAAPKVRPALVAASEAVTEHENKQEVARGTDAADEVAQANLQLTRRMVNWTAVLAVVGVVTVIVGGINVGVAYVQWKALLKADSTTREAFTAVQRPFIVANGLDATQDLPAYWSFRAILENTGSTPTKNMTVTSSVSLSVPILPDSPSDPLELKAIPDEPYPTITDHFVGPHGKVSIEAISLLTKTLEDMAEQRADFFVYGIARYSDQFAETQERSTKYCFVVRPYKGPNGLSLANRALCHHWNCGDADCDRDRRKYELERSDVLKRNPAAVETKKPLPVGAIMPFYPTPILKAR